MDEEEFFAWLESLSPEELEQTLYQFDFSNANAVPPSFNAGGYQPALSQGNFDLTGYGALPPSLNSKGEVQPFGLEETAKAFNALQDVGAMTVDPALAMYGGLGAYDPSAFEPTEEWGDILQQPGVQYAQSVAGSEGGYESYLAQKMLPDPMTGRRGKTSSQALAEMWADIRDSRLPDASKDVRDLGQALVDSLPPPAFDPSTPEGQYTLSQTGGDVDWSTPQGRAMGADLERITRFADDMFKELASDPQGYEGPGGLLYEGPPKITPSATAAKYQSAGIPLPTETYMDEEWLGAALDPATVTGRQEREAGAAEDYQRAAQRSNETDTNYAAMLKAYEEAFSPERQGRVDEAMAAQTEQQRGRGAALVPQNPGMAMRTGGQQFLQSRRLPGQEFQPNVLTDVTQVPGAKPEPLDRDAMFEKMFGNELPSMRETAGGGYEPLYNFGEGAANTMANRGVGALGQLASLVPGSRATGFDVEPLNPQMIAQERLRSTLLRAGRRNALQQQKRAQQQTSPDELARAGAVGRAMALMEAGRNPTNDVLMQRSMARNMLMGRG